MKNPTFVARLALLVSITAGLLGSLGAVTPASASIVGVYNNATELPTLKFLASARSTVDIEIYTMTDPTFRQILRNQLNRGIRIRVIKDPEPMGVNCYYFRPAQPGEDADCLDQKKLVSEVIAAGGTFVPFNKQTLCAPWTQGKCFEHGKMILLDAGTPFQSVLVSTGNFDSENFCNPAGNPGTCNRDYSVISTDPDIVNTLSAVFQRDLVGQAYDVRTLMSPAANEKLTISPYSTAPLVAFIQLAKSYIMIQNQYLHEKNINQALIDAAKRGVKVYVQVASLCAFGAPTPQSMDPNQPNSNGQIFTAFDQAGIVTRMFDGNQLINGRMGYLHAKAIIVDGIYAWVGSVNGSANATSGNREFGIFFNEPQMVKHLQSQMMTDFIDPRHESWQDSAQCKQDPPRPNSGGGN